MPKYDTSDAAIERDCTLETYTAGGPGGQHRNKTQNGVRLTHLPSGITVSATERRSLEANKKAAYERLHARLEKENEVKKPRRKTRPTRGSVERRLGAKAADAQKKTARRAPRRDD